MYAIYSALPSTPAPWRRTVTNNNKVNKDVVENFPLPTLLRRSFPLKHAAKKGAVTSVGRCTGSRLAATSSAAEIPRLGNARVLRFPSHRLAATTALPADRVHRRLANLAARTTAAANRPMGVGTRSPPTLVTAAGPGHRHLG